MSRLSNSRTQADQNIHFPRSRRLVYLSVGGISRIPIPQSVDIAKPNTTSILILDYYYYYYKMIGIPSVRRSLRLVVLSGLGTACPLRLHVLAILVPMGKV